jgi:hypothetical protein
VSLTVSEKEVLFSAHCFELQSWVNRALPTLDGITAVAQLASALPEIEIKDKRAFVTTCKKWLRVRQCDKFFRTEKAGIAEFLAESLLIEDWQTESNAALQHLVENFHFFGGKTRGDFLLWCAKRLNNLPSLKKHATLRDFIIMGIDDFDDTKRDLSDFTYTEHLMPFGKEYHIPLEDGHVWRVRDLRDAKGLWPVSIKMVNGTPYVVKVVKEHTIFVHRLFFKIGIGDVVRAYDSDFTNMSMYPFSRHEEAYWADWEKPRKYSEEKPDKKKTKDELKLTRAQGTKPIFTKLTQQWVSNLYVAHNTAVNASAQDRQTKFEETRMLQPLEFEEEDGTKKQVDFGGTSSGYLNPVASADVVRILVSGKNTPAWEKLDREDQRESAGVQHDMGVSAIRDYNRDADQTKYRAKDGDVAGEEPQDRESRRNQYEPSRASLIDDVEALEAEMEKASKRA